MIVSLLSHEDVGDGFYSIMVVYLCSYYLEYVG